MPEGLEYVIATYAITGVTLGVWFWMILAKLARLRREAATPTPASDGAAQ